VKDKALIGTIKSDLRNFASLQEDYFQKNYNYAPNAGTLVDFIPSSGVTITVTANAIDGWAATGTHSSLPAQQCGYFTGNATAADAPPATHHGVIGCN
jgi:hypothetical protein